jgi:hypothetical protein
MWEKTRILKYITDWAPECRDKKRIIVLPVLAVEHYLPRCAALKTCNNSQERTLTPTAGTKQTGDAGQANLLVNIQDKARIVHPQPQQLQFHVSGHESVFRA